MSSAAHRDYCTVSLECSFTNRVHCSDKSALCLWHELLLSYCGQASVLNLRALTWLVLIVLKNNARKRMRLLWECTILDHCLAIFMIKADFMGHYRLVKVEYLINHVCILFVFISFRVYMCWLSRRFPGTRKKNSSLFLLLTLVLLHWRKKPKIVNKYSVG